MKDEKKYIIEQGDGTLVVLRDLQNKCLEILEYFDDFCKKHDLEYTLCGGCCIGSLRNGGFIPWDDDIDLHMFRDDYEKLCTLWIQTNHPEKYKLRRTSSEEFHDTMLSQISDQDTTFIKLNQAHLDIDHGVKLEIIPLDGAPSGNLQRKIQLFWALMFYLFNRGFAPKNRGKMAYVAGKALLFLVPGKGLRAVLWKFAERKMTQFKIEESDYVTELCVTWKYMKIAYPKKIFMGKRLELFEGELYPIPLQAEDYLSLAFGDYRSLPPLEDQIPKHDSLYIDLHKPYVYYKNKYYPIKKNR